MPTAQPDNNLQPSSYIIPAAAATSVGNDAPTLCDIKIVCTQRKKETKSDVYLTFVESRPISSNEQSCIEILGKPKTSPLILDDCISFECFDTTKNDHQSFIYIYFESITVSIYFSDENMLRKPVIVKHLEHTYQRNKENSTQQSLQDVPCFSTTEHILHTFDVKLIPYESIITRDHNLVGPARLYFTTTDLYIASRDCNRMELTTTITNQCPTTNFNILCIPYFTIRHYGNRSNIFLIELGKSNYGNGEIHMKCPSSTLASTIHLLVSPVIEERPLALSSAFRNQFLTARRVQKTKSLQPPVQLNHDLVTQHQKKHSVESLLDQPTKRKSRSLFGLFRKLVKNNDSLQRSCTLVDRENPRKFSLQPFANKYFASFNLDEKKYFQERKPITSSESLATNNRISFASLDQLETDLGSYIDMGPTVKIPDQIKAEERKEEVIVKEPPATMEIGVNTTISLSPHVHSAIIVGSSVHLLADEPSIFPIGQRSFTSPASVMQPFKAQLNGQTTNIPSTCIANSSNSSYQSISPSDPHQSLLLSYGIVTFNNNSILSNETNYASDGSILDHRLNSEHSLISLSPQEQPSNLFSYDNILSSSSSSHIFRTLSLSTNNVCDNISGHLRTSNGSIIFFDENFPDQTTAYLLGPPSTTFIDENIQTNLTKTISRSSQSTYNDKDQITSDDPYALVEPVNQERSSVSSLPLLSITPLLPSEKSIIYTDVYLPSNTDDQRCDYPSHNGQSIQEKPDESSTIFYTDIDFYQIQRRNRIAQFAAISKLKDQMPPFVL